MLFQKGIRLGEGIFEFALIGANAGLFGFARLKALNKDLADYCDIFKKGLQFWVVFELEGFCLFFARGSSKAKIGHLSHVGTIDFVEGNGAKGFTMTWTNADTFSFIQKIIVPVIEPDDGLIVSLIEAVPWGEIEDIEKIDLFVREFELQGCPFDLMGPELKGVLGLGI